MSNNKNYNKTSVQFVVSNVALYQEPSDSINPGDTTARACRQWSSWFLLCVIIGSEPDNPGLPACLAIWQIYLYLFREQPL